MSTDKPTAADRIASAQPGCTCVHCEHRHGDQADPEFDALVALTRERDALRVDLTNARAEIEAKNVRLKRSLRSEAAAHSLLAGKVMLAESIACGFALEVGRELDRAHRALGHIAEVLRTPNPAIVDVLWIDQNPFGPHITLYELALSVLPADHPEVLRAERGGA